MTTLFPLITATACLGFVTFFSSLTLIQCGIEARAPEDTKLQGPQVHTYMKVGNWLFIRELWFLASLLALHIAYTAVLNFFTIPNYYLSHRRKRMEGTILDSLNFTERLYEDRTLNTGGDTQG